MDKESMMKIKKVDQREERDLDLQKVDTGSRMIQNQKDSRGHRKSLGSLVASTTDVYTTSLQSVADEQTVTGGGGRGQTKGQPTLDISLLKNEVFLVYLVTLFTANFGYPSVFTMLPSFAEEVSFWGFFYI